MGRIKNSLSRIREQRERIGKEIKEKTIGYILTALGLVAGLSWNEAIKSLIDGVFPKSNSIFIKFFYAIVVTVFIVLVTIYLVKFIEKKEEENNSN